MLCRGNDRIRIKVLPASILALIAREGSFL
jgi:hypothetical protein